jgi:DNA-directed RNA polymerase subunit alpha
MGETVTIQKNWQELIRPNKLQVTPGSDPTRFATIVAEPLERGFGQTLGNALRRILLSSLQGAAVQSVHIDGVLHEFSSIAGVREDVTDIVLNIKDISIKMQGEGPKRMVVKKSGPGVVTAGDIQTVGDVVVLNPDLQICTLDEGAEIRMEFTVATGKGQPVLAGPQGLLQGREHPRGPDPRLRQADYDDRDQRRDHAG